MSTTAPKRTPYKRSVKPRVPLSLDLSDMPGEEWRPVIGHEDDYVVSNLGRVKSLDRRFHTMRSGWPMTYHVTSRILRGGWETSGHVNVGLTIQGDGHTTRVHRRVHRLVLSAFVGPCPNGMEGCHDNGIPSDNRLENLRWDTPIANAADRVLHGTTLRAFSAEQDRAIAEGRTNGVSLRTLGVQYGVCDGTILAAQRRHLALTLPPTTTENEP